MKVLIVDDMLYIRNILTRSIAHIDETIEIFTADSDFAAVDLAKEHRPDLITLDLTMPGLGGDKLITKLLKASPDSKVAVLSALYYDEMKKKMAKKGAAYYMVKPVKLDRLTQIINEVREGMSASSDSLKKK